MRDNFEITIGNRLRHATAPVSPDAWQNIQSQLQPTTGAIPGFTAAWLASAAASLLLLGGVSWYSNLHNHSTHQSSSPAISIHSNEEVSGAAEPANPSLKLANEATSVQDENASIQATAAPKDAQVEVTAKWSVEELFPVTTEIKPTVPVSVRAEAKPALLRNSPEVNRAIKSLKEHAGTGVSAGAKEAAKIYAASNRGYAPFEVNLTAQNSAEEYRWEISNGRVSNSKKFTLSINEPGFHTVYLSTTDKAGRVTTDMMEIEVMEGARLFIPNSFTPNNDGINDVYKVEANLIEEFFMQIKTLEGKVVFETSDMLQGWEPDVYLLSSKTREPNVFIVSVVAKDVNGNEHIVNKKLNVIY